MIGMACRSVARIEREHEIRVDGINVTGDRRYQIRVVMPRRRNGASTIRQRQENEARIEVLRRGSLFGTSDGRDIGQATAGTNTVALLTACEYEKSAAGVILPAPFAQQGRSQRFIIGVRGDPQDRTRRREGARVFDTSRLRKDRVRNAEHGQYCEESAHERVYVGKVANVLRA